MHRAIPIRRPTPDADRPSPRGLALLALVCFGLGLALGARTRPKSAETATPPEAPAARSVAETIASNTPAEAIAAPSRSETIVPPTTNTADAIDAATTNANEAIAPPSAAQAIVAPTPVPPPTSTPGAMPASSLARSTVRIEKGRIAYIRCDGVPQRPGPVPCPRDPAMERVVWTAIDALPAQCPALATARGTADVRVVFDGRRFSGLGFHPATPPALADATRTCLEPRLEGLTQALGATRLTASFRFDAK